MRTASFSLWFGCIASSTVAFSTLSSSQFGRLTQQDFQGRANQLLPQIHDRASSNLRMVASVEPISVAGMERGVGGRIEAAFAAVKEKGEAAFVTFITAGYPTAKGA
jgi:hypothetical protein